MDVSTCNTAVLPAHSKLNFRNAKLEMINSEMEIEKLEVWNGPSRPPYRSCCGLPREDIMSLVLNDLSWPSSSFS